MQSSSSIQNRQFLSEEQIEPVWYKQFWPWFLIGLPAAVVLACGVTIYLAVVNPLNLVDKDYYKDGLAINQNLEGLQQAEKLGLHIEMVLPDGDGLLLYLFANNVKLQYPVASDKIPEFLQVHFLHPLDSTQDFSLMLKQVAQVAEANVDAEKPVNNYQIAYKSALAEQYRAILEKNSIGSRWYIKVLPVQTANRISVMETDPMTAQNPYMTNWELKKELSIDNRGKLQILPANGY